MSGEISKRKQKRFTDKIEKFLAKEYNPEASITTYTPKKGCWYITKMGNHFAVFTITSTSRSDFSIDYYLVYPDKTRKMDAIVVEILKDVWKCVAQPETISWDCIKEIWEQATT